MIATGSTIISNDRPKSVLGICRLIQRPITCGRGAISIGSQSVADAADCLQIARRFGVSLNFTPKPGHLHIHCAAGGIDGSSGELQPLNSLVRRACKLAQQRNLSLRKLDEFAIADQLAAIGVELTVAKRQGSAHRRTILRTAQYGFNAQQQLLRLEGLGQIVVSAKFETLDAV